MRIAPSDDQDVGDELAREAPLGDPQPPSGHLRLEAMRTWLFSGVHLVDRRRRFGGHGRARELLVVDQPVRNGASDRWQGLAASLHRHAVRGGLSELSPEEQRVITLAYLEGRTNREIASMLGVSVTTARRRLWVALDHLDAYLSRTGAWLSALVLAVAAYAAVHAARSGRWVATAAGTPDKAQRLAATLTAGVVTTAALGMVAFTSDSVMSSKSRPAATAPVSPPTTVTEQIANPNGLSTVGPMAIGPLVVTLADTKTKKPTSDGTPTAAGGSHHGKGCHGNPTNAPPSVPVGSRASHPGAPVTHPTAGGCKALAAG